MNNIERLAEFQDADRRPKVREKRNIGTITAASLATETVRARPWLIEHLIPRRQVTLLAGAGASGKSLLMLQLAVAVVRGREWLKLSLEQAPALYVGAEDDKDEIHRRLLDVAGDLRDLHDFHILPLAGQDAVLAEPEARGSEKLVATPLFEAIAERVANIKPKLVVVDTLADAFAGNENSRPQARQFIGLLRGLAIEHDLAVVVLSHPSVSGETRGTSGSTGWDASVRSRLFFQRQDGADPNTRKLTVMKSNYAAQGGDFELRWTPNGFVIDGGEVVDAVRSAITARADAKFLELLAVFNAREHDVSDKGGRNYAPALFANHPDALGTSRAMFIAAMDRLFRSKGITVEITGPESRKRRRLVTTGAP